MFLYFSELLYNCLLFPCVFFISISCCSDLICPVGSLKFHVMLPTLVFKLDSLSTLMDQVGPCLVRATLGLGYFPVTYRIPACIWLKNVN